MNIPRFVAAVAALAIGAITALAAPPTLEDFYADPQIGVAQLSPNGRYLAYNARAQANEQIIIRDLQTGETHAIVVFPTDSDITINWIRWKDDDRLLYAATLRAERRAGGVETGALLALKYGRAAFAIRRDGSDSVMLFDDNVGVHSRTLDRSRLLDVLRDDPDHVLMMAPTVTTPRGIYKVDVKTGRASLMEAGTRMTYDWFTDRTGAIIARYDSLGRRGFSVYGRDPKNGSWSEITKVTSPEMKALPDFDFLGPTDKPGSLYIRFAPEDADGAGTATVRVYDFAMHKMSDPIWNNPRYDVSGILRDPETYAMTGACYVADFFQCDLLDPKRDATFKAVGKFFGADRSIRVVSMSKDNKKWLLEVSAPQEPGALYLFDWDTKRVDPLADRWPRLPAASLAHMERFDYKSRDGADIRAYLSIPPGATTPLPLIVMPHGGPAARDDFAYDRWVQYLSTRGYAVLQPNFRGSGGFGRAFERSGYRQWGGRMVNDVTDGARTLIATGRVDPKRVCIVGASYGGYSALMSGAREPDLYKCVVSIAGASDLRVFMDSVRDEQTSGSDEYKYWLKSIGDPIADKAMLMEQSPVTYADRYKPPVLLVHGEYDYKVPIEQSKLMERALSDAGAKVKLVTIKEEGHPYFSEVHEKQMLTEIDAFLRTYLSP